LVTDEVPEPVSAAPRDNGWVKQSQDNSDLGFRGAIEYSDTAGRLVQFAWPLKPYCHPAQLFRRRLHLRLELYSGGARAPSCRNQLVHNLNA